MELSNNTTSGGDCSETLLFESLASADISASSSTAASDSADMMRIGGQESEPITITFPAVEFDFDVILEKDETADDSTTSTACTTSTTASSSCPAAEMVKMDSTVLDNIIHNDNNALMPLSSLSSASLLQQQQQPIDAQPQSPIRTLPPFPSRNVCMLRAYTEPPRLRKPKIRRGSYVLDSESDEHDDEVEVDDPFEFEDDDQMERYFSSHSRQSSLDSSSSDEEKENLTSSVPSCESLAPLAACTRCAKMKNRFLFPLRSNSRTPRFLLDRPSHRRYYYPHRRRYPPKCMEYTALSSSSSHVQSYPPKRKQQRCLISAEHPLKILWDVLTVVLSFVHAYATHASIRDRNFRRWSSLSSWSWSLSTLFSFSALSSLSSSSSFLLHFCEVWFGVDILLNFVTEKRVHEQRVLTDLKAVTARYLTSWFVVDVLSVIPFEVWLVQPIIEQQNRRGFFQKSVLRTRAVLRVSQYLLKQHAFLIPLLGQTARQTKPWLGIGANRLVQLLIRYVPKYWLFVRSMKAIVLVRLLRQVHWLRNVYGNYRRNHHHNHHHHHAVSLFEVQQPLQLRQNQQQQQQQQQQGIHSTTTEATTAAAATVKAASLRPISPPPLMNDDHRYHFHHRCHHHHPRRQLFSDDWELLEGTLVRDRYNHHNHGIHDDEEEEEDEYTAYDDPVQQWRRSSNSSSSSSNNNNNGMKDEYGDEENDDDESSNGGYPY